MENVRSIKKHLVGFETELLLLEENGSVSSRADELISKAQSANLKIPIHKEYTKNMIEFSSIAKVEVRKGVHIWLETMAKVIDIAKGMGLKMYPFGTYLGKHVPIPRTDEYYRMCESVMGPEEYIFNTGHVSGFHFHYNLPYGTLNRKTRTLRQLFRSKYRGEFLNLYNIIIALDPAATNFMESSPFVDGHYVAKDSRLFLYRAMEITSGKRNYRGLYADKVIFGRLPSYASTLSDLIMLTQKRYDVWRKLVEDDFPKYLNIVDELHPFKFNWGPLRINRVGTFEYRGMDMNFPSHIIGTSLLIKYLLRKIQVDDLDVTVSDIGIKEPFKIEGQKIYVPPYSYVDEILQYKSAQYGLADDQIYKYTKAFANIAFKAMPNRNDPGIERIKKMLETRQTMSDSILESARREGHVEGDRLSESIARTIALRSCEQFEDEIDKIMRRELVIDTIDNVEEK